MKGKTRAKKARRDWLKKVHGSESACGGKRGHADKAEAEAVIVRMRSGPNFRERAGFTLAVYRCAACGLWKIGNKPVPVPRVRARQRRSA